MLKAKTINYDENLQLKDLHLDKYKLSLNSIIDLITKEGEIDLVDEAQKESDNIKNDRDYPKEKYLVDELELIDELIEDESAPEDYKGK